MAFFSVRDISIKGLSAAVPKSIVSNFELKSFEETELAKLISTIGIEHRRISNNRLTASDLCETAANKLIEDLNWNKEEIEVLFLVTQTPDYILPGTSTHLQHRLGLPKTCITFDINQGCAGYVYGLSLISSFMSASKLKKGLLLVGDTITKFISPEDKSLTPIFSDAGTATALYNDEADHATCFNISTEGGDYDAIIVKEGGARDTGTKNKQLQMKGLDVFNFSLKKVTPNVEELLVKAEHTVDDIDYFVFHQANKLILEAISEKLGIHKSKVPSSLKEYGNTSGATIPLTIVKQFEEMKKIEMAKLVLSGFGVGLSLASAIVEFKDVTISKIIEV